MPWGIWGQEANMESAGYLNNWVPQGHSIAWLKPSECLLGECARRRVTDFSQLAAFCSFGIFWTDGERAS